MTRRLLALVVAAVMSAPLVITAPATPAAAHADVCAGMGDAFVGTPFVYPVIDPNPRSTYFSMALQVGACVRDTGSWYAQGSINGWCGLLSGRGMTGNSHAVHFVGVGDLLLVTGQVFGTLTLTPDVVNFGTTCASGVNRFITSGPFAGFHCGVGVSVNLTSLAFTGADHCSIL